jgi:hypothetical protein
MGGGERVIKTIKQADRTGAEGVYSNTAQLRNSRKALPLSR